MSATIGTNQADEERPSASVKGKNLQQASNDSPASHAASHPASAACESTEDDLRCRVQAAVECVSQSRLLQPEVAIILGSGLGGLANDIQHATAIAYSEIPYFQTTHAVGHKGQLVLGFLAGLPVVVMQGRYHRYEGHSAQSVSFPVHVMHELGAKTLIVTNAAGGLNPRYRPGDLMLVDQHINALWPRRDNSDNSEIVHSAITGSDASLAAGLLRQHTEIYDSALLDRARRIAVKHDVNLQRGTYVATLGPTYETRSEYRMFRWMGGDAVGMSTVPEVLAARSLGMRVLAISVITNVACTDEVKGTSHNEVVACGQQVEPQLRKIVQQLLEEMSGPAD